MEASLVLQSLDSLWFYSNIFTCSDDPLPSLTPSTHPDEPPKCDSPLVNLQDESEEIVEIVNVALPPEPCEPEITEAKDGGGGRKRRKRRKRSERRGSRKSGFDLGFGKKQVTGTFKLNNPSSWALPYHDEMAMKEHLKSWAYAVACIVK